MKRRLSAALVVWLGLWLWPADRASAADSMYGGGVSSSGSQPWSGGHNNMPRQTLSPVGTVFTPLTSFGNYWILNNAAGQTIACPPDIADGDSMNVHLQYGSGAPYSPAISFSAPCYGWTTGTQPPWSENTIQSDSVFCQSMNPPDITGASFVCAPQLNVAPPAGSPTYAIVAHNIGAACGSVGTCPGTSVSFTSTTNQLALVDVAYCDTGAGSCAGGATQGVTVSGVAQTAGTATSTCARATGVAGVTDSVAHTTQDVFICTPTALGASGTATYTATFAGPGGIAHAPVVSTVIVSGVTTSSPDGGIGKAAAGVNNPSVTTTVPTTQAGEFLFSAAIAIGGASPTAGTGYTQIDSSGSVVTQWAPSGAIGSTPSAGAVATGQTGSNIAVLGVKH